MKKHFFQSFTTITSPSKFLNDSPPPHPTERAASTHNAPPSPSGQFHDAPSALFKISFVLCPGFTRSIQQLTFCEKSRRFLSANRLYFWALISMQTKYEVTKFPCSLSTKICHHKCRKSERTRFLISNHLQPSGCANCFLATFCWRSSISKKKKTDWYHFPLWGDVKRKKTAVSIFIIKNWINTRQPKENKSC